MVSKFCSKCRETGEENDRLLDLNLLLKNDGLEYEKKINRLKELLKEVCLCVDISHPNDSDRIDEILKEISKV